MPIDAYRCGLYFGSPAGGGGSVSPVFSNIGNKGPEMILVLLYLLGCTVCGIMGRNTAWGFMGHFFLSIILTPIGDLFVQVAGRPSREIQDKIDRLGDTPDTKRHYK